MLFVCVQLMPVNSLVVNLENIGDFYMDQDCSLQTLTSYSIQVYLFVYQETPNTLSAFKKLSDLNIFNMVIFLSFRHFLGLVAYLCSCYDYNSHLFSFILLFGPIWRINFWCNYVCLLN